MQYSDDAKTEFRLNAYQDKGIMMSALELIRYRGGNTKTGPSISIHSSISTKLLKMWSIIVMSFSVQLQPYHYDPKQPKPSSIQSHLFLHLAFWPGHALKHTYEKAFSVQNGKRRSVPKIVVAITDGRSQDEVNKNAALLQHAGKGPRCLFHSCSDIWICLHPVFSMRTRLYTNATIHHNYIQQP